MNWRVRVLKIVCAIFLSVLLKPAFCQNYYIVIGAFASEKDDIREFTTSLPGTFPDTAYTVYKNDNLFHFYVLRTSNKELALAKATKLQEGIEKNDTQFLNTVNSFKESTSTGNTASNGTNSGFPNQVTGSAAGTLTASSGVGLPLASAPLKPKGKFFKFTISAPDGTGFNGELHQVDLSQGRELGSFPSNNYVDVLRPGKDQPMTIVCGIFGYKPIDKFIDYSDPSTAEGVYQDEQGAWVIPYQLERLEKGDVSVMYNVSFYKDAVVMLPGSKEDLDELVNMMNSNPNYKIKIHSYCNKKNSRKIITLGKDQNYFDVKGSIEQRGTAKELTNLRGEAAKAYLMNHGISEKRIKIYGWGKAEMLVDENSRYAKLNDRLEIEILKD